MTTHSRKDFDVYEFKDESEIEFPAKRFVEKYSRTRKKNSQQFRSPNEDTCAVRKYQIPITFSAGIGSQAKNMNSSSCMDDRPSDRSPTGKDYDVPTLGTFDTGDCASKEGTSSPEKIPVSSSISPLEDAQTSPDIVVRGNPFPECVGVSSFGAPCWSESPCAIDTSRFAVPSPGDEQINCNLSENDLVDVISDDDGSTTCSSGMRDDRGTLEGSTSDHCSGGWEMDDINTAVVSPDYLIYKDIYSTESSLCFSCSGIKIEGVDASGSKGKFSFEMDIGDIMGIESQWWPKVETVLVKLCARSIADLKSEIPVETSGIVELKFAICDPHWLESQEEIMEVDSRYRTIWRVLLDIDANEEGDFFGKNQICYSRPYYPIFDVPFQDVIYPKGDPDAVSIGKRDVELLEPGTFINDTIIDFYIKYLKTKLKPEERNKFHFFNSFFFRKLADLDKNQSSTVDGRAAFMRVCKWTRRVNLFEKDYVFIPVNFSLHWSLIVICHPGEIATFKDEEVDKSLKVPCILHMDSIKGSHKGLKDLVQSYLWEEWKGRQQGPSEDISSNFLNLRFVPLELPQQENSFDCGLFLLHYAERFLDEAPVCFNPFKLTKFSNFLNLDWFPPAEASLKRAFIQRLINELLNDQSQGIPSAVHDTECQTFQSVENICDKEKGIEIHLEGQIATDSCNGFSSCPNDDQGIGIELLGRHAVSQSFEDSRLVLKELFDPPMAAESLPNGKFCSVDQILSPIKEIEETDEQFALSPGVTVYQQQTEYTVDDACTTSYLIKDFAIYDTFSKSGISVLPSEGDPDVCSSSEASSSSSQSQSSALVVGENLAVNGSMFPNTQEVTQMPQEISMENDVISTRNTEVSGGCTDTWQWWNSFRLLCEHHNQLSIALDVLSTLPSGNSLGRWFGEPVRAAILHTNAFLTNARGYPCLSKRHQKLIEVFFNHSIQIVVSGKLVHSTFAGNLEGSNHTNDNEASHPLRSYLDYVGYLYQRMDPLPEQERFEIGYRDFLQSPLQPLMDNLEAQTYETFEKDTVKYSQYQRAVCKALVDRVPDEKVSTITTVLMVVGAGRGPLVRASLQAAEETGRKLKIYAVEKNPNAVVTLHSLVKLEGWENVSIISCDMRSWNAPEQADILVSELLGSFGDNELSPECLDGAQRFLKQDGISIPSSYTSFIQPVTASKLYNDVRSHKDLAHFETAYVVKLHSIARLSPSQPVFTFTHPDNSTKKSNQRYTKLRFEIPRDTGSAIVHGFAGYFDATLYKDVHLGIEPSMATPNMFSWFAIFFPLRTPVCLQPGTPLEVHFWRCCGSTKVWYEWCVTSPISSPIHNCNGRSYWVGL